TALPISARRWLRDVPAALRAASLSRPGGRSASGAPLAASAARPARRRSRAFGRVPTPRLAVPCRPLGRDDGAIDDRPHAAAHASVAPLAALARRRAGARAGPGRRLPDRADEALALRRRLRRGPDRPRLP